MKQRHTLHKNRGFGLLEILISVAILSASLIALTATSQISFRLMKNSLERAQASLLVEEGVEVVRILRDIGWSVHIASRTVGTTYYPTFSTTTGTWALAVTAPPSISNLFTRTIIFGDVYRRDSDSEIVAESSTDPKTLDPGTKHIISRVAWGSAMAKNIEIETYITNMFQN